MRLAEEIQQKQAESPEVSPPSSPRKPAFGGLKAPKEVPVVIQQQSTGAGTELVVEKLKAEFERNIQEQLRKAQASVIARCRMDNRNLLKLWSLKLRKDVVTWMATVQDDMHHKVEFVQKVDERGRQCEDKQFEILDVLQKQMRQLDGKLEELKET